MGVNEVHRKEPITKSLLDKFDGLVDGVQSSFEKIKSSIDLAIEESEAAFQDLRHKKFIPGFDAEGWLEGADFERAYSDEWTLEDEPPHHGKPNKTIYELISESKYTTQLAKLINNDTELVEVLNSTKANFTLFAPTDHAFSKIPEHAPKPSKEFIRKVLLYHVSPGLYPAGRLLFSHTVPTLFNETL